MDDADFSLDALQVRVADLLVATADHADPVLHPAVGEVLRLLREHMGMDLAFVSQFTGDRRVIRRLDQREPLALLREGDADPLEDSWCHMIVTGQMPQFIADASREPTTAGRPTPFPIGTHLSVPIVLADGSVYGTLCMISQAPSPTAAQRDLMRLRHTARLTALKIDQARRRQSPA